MTYTYIYIILIYDSPIYRSVSDWEHWGLAAQCALTLTTELVDWANQLRIHLAVRSPALPLPHQTYYFRILSVRPP